MVRHVIQFLRFFLRIQFPQLWKVRFSFFFFPQYLCRFPIFPSEIKLLHLFFILDKQFSSTFISILPYNIMTGPNQRTVLCAWNSISLVKIEVGCTCFQSTTFWLWSISVFFFACLSLCCMTRIRTISIFMARVSFSMYNTIQFLPTRYLIKCFWKFWLIVSAF